MRFGQPPKTRPSPRVMVSGGRLTRAAKSMFRAEARDRARFVGARNARGEGISFPGSSLLRREARAAVFDERRARGMPTGSFGQRMAASVKPVDDIGAYLASTQRMAREP